jgi:hypothetical protein
MPGSLDSFFGPLGRWLARLVSQTIPGPLVVAQACQVTAFLTTGNHVPTGEPVNRTACAFRFHSSRSQSSTLNTHMEVVTNGRIEHCPHMARAKKRRNLLVPEANRYGVHFDMLHVTDAGHPCQNSSLASTYRHSFSVHLSKLHACHVPQSPATTIKCNPPRRLVPGVANSPS